MLGKTFEEIFKGKRSSLEKKIDTGELLAKLLDYSIITQHHREVIEVISIIVWRLKVESFAADIG